MPIGLDTHVTRRNLPHLARRGKAYYVTFCTQGRAFLPPAARDIVLASCIRDHETTCWVDSLTVMPDHAHLVVLPYETTSISEVLRRMKGGSSFHVNRLLGRRGTLWQSESFDRIVRAGDNLAKKREYIFNNAVRAGLVARWEDYRWNWSPYWRDAPPASHQPPPGTG